MSSLTIKLKFMQTKNRPSGTLNGIAIFCGILFTILTTLLLWMSEIRIPLSLAIGICSGIAVAYASSICYSAFPLQQCK